MTELRVLNAYAGIGGNRHLWPANWRVTAVELDERIAAEYARRYPVDEVIVGDAHTIVMERSGDFEAVWTSPPCPTHSKLAKVNASKFGKPIEPDPRLWAEIEHLSASAGRYVVENVHTYYEPPVSPDLVTERHYYWTSNPPVMLTPAGSASGLLTTRARRPRTGAHADAYGLPRIPRGAVSDARRALRNAVVPIEGLEVALAAFVPQLVATGSGGSE